jgi:hypothetical protein
MTFRRLQRRPVRIAIRFTQAVAHGVLLFGEIRSFITAASFVPILRPAPARCRALRERKQNFGSPAPQARCAELRSPL